MDTIGFCDKCRTFSKLYPYDDRYLCTVNSCFYEEQEKVDPKVQSDRDDIEKIRTLMNSTREETLTTDA